MKFTKTILCSFLSLVGMDLIAQQICTEPTAGTYLHGNDIRAYISNNGGLFMNPSGQGIFQVPYNAGDSLHTSTIYTAGLWVTSIDPGGNYLGAARTYGANGTDYFAGPLDSFGSTNSTICADFNRVWSVERSEVEAFIQDYLDNGVVQTVAPALLSWPGRNNPYFQVAMGFALPADRDFAPFYDHDGNGDYNPYMGDYPVFKEGDPSAIAEQLIWSIYNDNGNIHTESNLNPMLIEVHQTAYALSCPFDPLLNRTIFTKHKIVNKNILSELFEPKAGFWIDFDLGNYQDDYLGTDSVNNAIYVYNADNMDETNFNTVGYGEKPPVQSVMLLNKKMNRNHLFINSGNPAPSPTVHNIMKGYDINGNPLPYNYVFSGAPADTNSNTYSMHHDSLTAADYRMLMVSDIDSIITPNAVYEMDLAFVYHRDTTLADNIQMTTLIGTELPLVQDWYDNGFPASCFPAQTLALREALQAAQEVALFPNPNSGHFTLKLNNSAAFQVRIFNAAGQLCHQQSLEGAEQYELKMPEALQGLCFYQLSDAKGVVKSGTFVVQK